MIPEGTNVSAVPRCFGLLFSSAVPDAPAGADTQTAQGSRSEPVHRKGAGRKTHHILWLQTFPGYFQQTYGNRLLSGVFLYHTGG